MNGPVVIDARLVGGRNTGDSTYWTGLLYGFARIRPETRIVLVSNADRPRTIPEIDSFEWIVLRGRSRWWSLARFPLAARRMKAAAIHVQYSLSPLAGRVGFTTIHDVSYFVGPEWFKPLDLTLLTRSVPAAARRAKGIFAVSQTSKREIERFIPEAIGKTHVTYNACPPWIERVPIDAARERVRSEFEIEAPFLLTVGTRWPRKNMALAVRAAALLPEALPHRLVITGKEGWGSQELGSRGMAVGYAGNEQLNALYSAAALYIAPSRHEGFGIPVLEAFRCGCPVVSSTGGALPEVAGRAAEIVPGWDPADWSKRIGELLSDPSKLEGLAREGTARETEFSWEETARRTLKAYVGEMR